MEPRQRLRFPRLPRLPFWLWVLVTLVLLGAYAALAALWLALALILLPVAGVLKLAHHDEGARICLDWLHWL
jgi:hypothetical protein